MDAPIESYFHVGIVHAMAYPECLDGEGPILETLSRIVEDEFFGAVEVTWIKDDKVRRQAAQLLESSHLDIIFAGQPPLLMQKLDLNSQEEKERQEAIDQCKNSVDQSYQLGARIMPVLSGPDPGEDKRESATALLVDSLNQICQYAQEKGEEYLLAISLETFDRTIDKKCLIGPVQEAAAMAKAVKESFSNFGLTVDLSHLPMLGESAHEMLIDATDDLIHVHLGNCVLDKEHPLYGDTHPRFGIPGGCNDVEEVRQFLEVLVYTGFFRKSVPTSLPVVSVEVKPQEGESSGAVIANAKRTLKDAWARL